MNGRNLEGASRKTTVPFCTNCGNSVPPEAAYCAHCGAAQARNARPAADAFGSLSDRNASMLCYIPFFGVFPAIVFLATQRYRNNARVRFDAFQSLYLFVGYLILSTVLPPLLWLSFHPFGGHSDFVSLLKLLMILLWIFLLVKASQQEKIHLPIVGDLAARSAAEQA